MTQPGAVFEQQPCPVHRPSSQAGGQPCLKVVLGRVVIGKQGPSVEEPDSEAGRRGQLTETLGLGQLFAPSFNLTSAQRSLCVLADTPEGANGVVGRIAGIEAALKMLERLVIATVTERKERPCELDVGKYGPGAERQSHALGLA